MIRNGLGSFLATLVFIFTLYSDYRYPGGSTTVFESGKEAFTQPANNLDPRSLAQFFSGDTIFNTNWVNASSIVNGRDGLGPLFNTRSCSACHFKDGRGEPPQKGEISNGFLIRISSSQSENEESMAPHPIYGNQLSVRALPGLQPEVKVDIEYQEITGHYPDGTGFSIQKPNYKFSNWSDGEPIPKVLFSPRVASSVFGLGLLDTISDDAILSQSDPEDKNGDSISGKPNWVPSVSERGLALGKFGWKANKANLIDQTAGAFQGDMGITSSYFPSENHTSSQIEPNSFPSGGNPEIVDRDLEDVVFYLKTLAPPASRFSSQADYQTGLERFTELQCARCHTPEFRTLSNDSVPALSDQVIHPYTDLLLHDMGEQLADHRPDHSANGYEWRTPPLWGIGLIPKVNGHTRLLHDGRARNIEEAILWHGGEAEGSKLSFMKLSASERRSLIDFVESL